MTRQSTKPEYTCLTYCALPYAGAGWPQSCVNILSQFAARSIEPVLHLPRVRSDGPGGVQFAPCLGFPLSRAPWHLVQSLADRQLAKAFKSQLDRADPASTIAYCWPGTPPEIVEYARARGIVTVREMINCCMATAKPILDEAYQRAGLSPKHSISEAAALSEKAELRLYDYVFASNPCAEDSLVQVGFERARILSTSFGWEPARFTGGVAGGDNRYGKFRALFVGTACVRKGVPELIEAWVRAGVQGELVIVGDVEPCLAALLESAARHHSVKLVSFTPDLAQLYRSCDVFVFPTLEEGGPQVTLEAGGCGLPVITTPMGASRLVENGINGLIVQPGQVDDLAKALLKLAKDKELRQRFASQIAIDAQAFAYDRVSASRANMLVNLLQAQKRGQMVELAGSAQL